MLRELAEFCGEEGLILLLDTFLEDFEHNMEKLRTALLDRDWRSLARHAHSMRSGLGSLGATGLCELARAIEEHAPAGDTATLTDLVRTMDAASPQVLAALRDIRQDPDRRLGDTGKQ